MPHLLFLLLLLSSTLFGRYDVTGIYVGLGSGLGQYRDGGMLSKEFDIDHHDEYSTFPPTAFYGGYQVSRAFGVEVNIFNHGRFYGENDYSYTPIGLFVGPNLGFYLFQGQLHPFVVMGVGAVYAKQHGLNAETVGDNVSISLHMGPGIELSPKKLDGLSFRVALAVDFYEYHVAYDNSAAFYYSEFYGQRTALLYMGAHYKF